MSTSQKPQLKLIPVKSIVLDPDNPRFFEIMELEGRKNLTEADLMEELEKDPEIPTLSKSIVRNGIKDPIWVLERSDGRYLVIEGNRRTFILRNLIDEQTQAPAGIHYDAVPAYVLPAETLPTELLLQRARLQAGKRMWGPFNEAATTFKLRTDYGMEEEDIADNMQISIREVRDRIENYKLLLQYAKATGDTSPTKYSFFAEAPARVREWYRSSPENLSTYFNLISPREGFQKIRSATTKGGLRDFKDILDTPEALKKFVRDPNMTVDDALKIVLESDIKKQAPVLKKLPSIARDLNSIEEDQVRKLRKEEAIVRSIKSLQRACERLLAKLDIDVKN